MALLVNVHYDTEGMPYTPEDLLGTGNRAGRKAQKIKDDIAARKRLMQSWAQERADKEAVQRGERPEGLPDWVPLAPPRAPGDPAPNIHVSSRDRKRRPLSGGR